MKDLILSYPGIFLIDKKNIEFLPFGRGKPDPEHAANALMNIREGNLVKEAEKVFNAYRDEKFYLESQLLVPLIRSHYQDIDFQVMQDWGRVKNGRERISEKLEELFGGRRKYNKFANRVGREIAIKQVSKAGEKKDLEISEIITVAEEIAKMVNNFVSHLKDFYGYYFPELPDLVEDNELYLKLVTLGKKEQMTLEELKKITDSGNLTKKIYKAKEESLKVRFKDETIHMLQEIARKALDLAHLRRFLLNRLEELMKEVAPNITALIGSKIGAKLIKEIGGLKNLSEAPSSTIQVIGAEQALFRALRGEGSPPKHGLIFQDPRIHSAPKDLRGKIARAIANKLAIAARVDYFSDRCIGEQLNNDLDVRLKEIRKES